MSAYEPLELLQLGGLPDEDVLGDGVEVAGLGDGVAVGADEAVVDQVKRAEMGLRGVATDGVVVPGAIGLDRLGGTAWRTAQGRDALGDGVGVSADQLHLGIDHLVDPDEVGAHHIPVHMLEREVKIVEGAEAFLQDAGHLVGGGGGKSGCGE